MSPQNDIYIKKILLNFCALGIPIRGETQKTFAKVDI